MKPKELTLRGRLVDWNNKHPYDLAFRVKYGIRFGSEEHKSMDFISMLFNLIQDRDIEEYMNREEAELSKDEDQLFDSKEVVKMTKEEIEQEFDDLDLSTLNDNNIVSHGDTTGDNI